MIFDKQNYKAMITKNSVILLLLLKFLVFQSLLGQSIPVPTLTGHEDLVRSVAFSPDGSYVISGSADNTIKIWDVSTGKEISTFSGHSRRVNSVAFSPDGQYVVSVSNDRTIKLWDVSTGKEIHTLTATSSYVSVTSAAFSPDGRYMASGSMCRTVRIWDVSTGSQIHRLRLPDGVKSLDFSPDGQYLVAGSFSFYYSTIKLFDVSTGKEIQTLTDKVRSSIESVAFSPDGQYILASVRDTPHGGITGRIKLWDVSTGKEIQTLTGHERTVYSVAFSPDGRYVISGSADNTIKLWDVSTGKEIRTLSGHRNNVLSVAFSPNGQYVVSGSADNTIKLWYVFNSIVSWEFPKGYPDKLDQIINSRSDLFAPRDQFETNEEYTHRQLQATKYLQEHLTPYYEIKKNKKKTKRIEQIAESRQEVELDVELGNYDADNQLYPITVGYITENISIDRENARRLHENRHSLVAKGIEQLTQDLESKEIINISFTNPVTGESYSFGIQRDIEEYVSPTAVSAPPSLTVSDPVFTDTDGDNRLSAGEHAIIQFTIENTGKGIAQGVTVRGNTQSEIAGLSAQVGNIQPGESRSISLAISGKESLQDGQATITLNIKESMGFHADPVELRIPTRAYRPPEIVVHDVGVDDPQGRGVITPGQVVDITVRLLNVGEGTAEDATVNIEVGNNLFLADNADRRKQIGTIEPGTYKDINFSAFSNREAEAFPITISLSERTGKHGLQPTDLGLTLHTPQRTARQLVVEAKDIDHKVPDAPGLRISIERDIPQAIQQNPDAVAVIIGNRTYRGDTPDVSFAIRDASMVRRYVEEAMGYRPGNIIYREDATFTDFRVLFGDKDSPQGRLKDMVREGVSDVFIYYSGHGAPDPNTNTGYLMPVDADPNRLSLSGYPLEVLYENLAKLGARSLTVVVDACFSGATGAGDMLIAEASPIGIEIRDPSARIDNGTIITASTGSQIASWHPEKRHGLLTYFFLKGIQGAADFDEDGRITVGELRQYLADPVHGLPYYARRLHSRDQTPQVWGEANKVIR